jgi:hypothetical protein
MATRIRMEDPQPGAVGQSFSEAQSSGWRLTKAGADRHQCTPSSPQALEPIMRRQIDVIAVLRFAIAPRNWDDSRILFLPRRL